GDERHHHADDDEPGIAEVLQREQDVHAHKADDHLQRQQHQRDNRQDTDHLVDAVRCQCINGIGQVGDDLGVVVNDVARLLEVVDNVPELPLEVVVNEGPLKLRQVENVRNLRADDPAQCHDVTPHDGNILNGALHVLVEHRFLDAADVRIDFIQDREDVVHEPVDHGV